MYSRSFKIKIRGNIDEYGARPGFRKSPGRPGYDSGCRILLLAEPARVYAGFIISSEKRLAKHNLSPVEYISRILQHQRITKTGWFREYADLILDARHDALYDMPHLLPGQGIVCPAAENGA